MRSRRHHNNHGRRQIKEGKTVRQVAVMAARLGIPVVEDRLPAWLREENDNNEQH
jgi:hypothetical protein